MPYIPTARRIELRERIHELAGDIQSPGELNYVLTRVVVETLDNHGPVSYARLAEAHAALTMAAAELYRRVIAPYEDRKRAVNGDVYGEVIT